MALYAVIVEGELRLITSTSFISFTSALAGLKKVR